MAHSVGIEYPGVFYQSLVENHGIDPGIVCLSYLGYLKWFLGHGDEAQKYSDQALFNAERIRHPFTLAFASTFRAYLSQHLRDAEHVAMKNTPNVNGTRKAGCGKTARPV